MERLIALQMAANEERRREAASQQQQQFTKTFAEQRFEEFQTRGILLRDAAFMHTECRRRIAGLVASELAIGAEPEAIPRDFRRTYFRDRIIPTEQVAGWRVRFPKTRLSHEGRDDVGHEVDDTEALIVTSLYGIICARKPNPINRLYPADFQVPDDVVETMAYKRLRWVEPHPATYRY